MRTTAWPCILLATVCLGAREVPKGRAVPSVRSAAKPEQSYALYVPSGYDAARRWPIVYAFDPAGLGTRPLELMKDAAERHGYLVAASNNSRNGPWHVSQEAAAEVWDDTHRWLAIDDRRVYFAGFSGGARVSAQLAQLCRCARGAFLVGAGFNTGSPPSRDAVFAVLSMTGLGDFNYGELVELDAQLEGLGFPHLLRRFEGEHAWAPAAEWDEALAWSALLEMRDGVRSRDLAFVAAELAQALERGRRREAAGEPALALAEYKSAATAFAGLADTGVPSARITALQKDPGVRSGAERERAEIARQRSLEAEILGPMHALRDAGGDRITLRADVARRIRGLRGEMQAELRSERRRIFQRVVGGVYVSAMETGRSLVETGGARAAASFFELAAEARPDLNGPQLALARCHGALGDEKAALRALQRAVAAGLTAGRLAAAVAADETLAKLAETEGYRKLLASAPAEAPAP